MLHPLGRALIYTSIFMKFPVYLPGVLLAPVELLAQTDGTSEAVARVAKATGDSTTLWKLVETGGWAMIPLGVMSVLAVMLIVVFLFTMRRGGILTAKYMNTADVLLKKRDYPGLLSISSRHSESIARVVQRTLDFAT